ncbi:MAG: sensor histidine kinase, partial [Saprospiraceae bacterium]
NGSKKEYVDSVKHYYTLADKYYEQSKSIAETYNYRKFQAIALMEQIDNIIYYNNVTGGENNRATELGVYRSYLNETEQLTNELNANEIKLLYYFSAGKVAVEQSDYATSIEYGERIVETAKKTNDVAKVVLGYYSMANGYYGARDFKNAYDFIEKTYLTQIEKITTDNSTMLLDLETKYQTAQKEQEITQQRNDILELEVANAAVTRQRNLAVGGGIFLLLMGYLTYWLNKVVQDRNDKRAFAEALLLAQDTERKRIARDLHDGVGQSLLLLIKQTERNEIDSNINQKLMMETLEEVRSISRDLHPFKIDKLGLTSAIEDILNRVEQSTDLFLTHELENIDSAIAKKDQIHLYRVVQEAMNNIVKHSGATAAKVTVENLEKSVHITIRDNGKGFDHELAIVKTKSLGLRTMHERITNLNGEFTIKNNEPSGVLLEISVPKQV